MTRQQQLKAFSRNFARASSGSMAVAQAFVVKLLMVALNLGTGVLSARFLGPAGRAEQAALLLAPGLLPTLLSFSLPIALQFRIREDPDAAARLISTAVMISILLGILCVPIGYAVLPPILAQYPVAILHSAQALLVVAPSVILFNVFNSVLRARNRFAESNISQYGPLALTLASLCFLAIAHRLTPITSAAAWLSTSVLATCWLWTLVKPDFPKGSILDCARSLMSFGVRVYANDVLGLLALQIDAVLVIALLSPRSMGLYAVALSAARLSDLFSGAIVTVLFPKAAALPRPEILELATRVGRLSFGLLAVTAIANIATIPFLLPAFFGGAFAGAVPAAQILAVTFVLNGTGYVMSQAFIAAGKPTVIALTQAVGLITVIPLLVFMIPKYGLVGAAWALVFGALFRTAATWLCFPIVLSAPIPAIVPTIEDIRFVGESLARRLSAMDA